MRYTDLMEIKSENERKNTIRKRICELLKTKLSEEFGSEFTRLLLYDIYVNEGGSKIPSNTIIVDVGDIVAKDGFSRGVLCQIEITVKNWNDTLTAKTNRAAITLDDVDEGIKIAEELAQKKAESERIKKENKLKQIQKQRDKKKE